MTHDLCKHRCLATASILCLSLCSYAQSAVPVQNDLPDKANIVQQMRTLYYTPTTAGLRSFSCHATIDWRAVLQNAAAGKELAANDPRILYLNQNSLSFRLKLDGDTEVVWNSPPGPPPGNAAAFDQMKNGTIGMLRGFTKVWTVFLNGTLLPLPAEKDYQLTRGEDGVFDLVASHPGTIVEEKFTANYTMTEYHVKTGALDVDFFPTFAKTADGLLLTELAGTYASGTPATAHITLHGGYQEVGGYQVLQKFDVALLNVGRFSFTFDNCQINQDDPLPGAVAPSAAVPNKTN